MSTNSTTFVDQTTVIEAAWCNDINNAVFNEAASVTQFGAVGDGSHDDWSAFNQAIAFCELTGKTLYIPAGNYKLDTSNGSITLKNINIVGTNVYDMYAPTSVGSVISIIGTTNSPFKVKRGVSISGLVFYHPSQTDTNPPVSYPATLVGDFTGGPIEFLYITNNVFVNSYVAIQLNNSSGSLGHTFITNNTICGLNCGISIERHIEIVKIMGNTFTFSHWGAVTGESGARKYMRENSVALYYGWGDGLFFTNNFVFGYKYGINCYYGQMTVAQIANNNFDQVVRCIVFGSGANAWQVNIIGNQFLAWDTQNSSLVYACIEFNATTLENNVTITGNYFEQTTGNHILMSNVVPRGGVLNIVGNRFESWAYNQTSDCASIAINDSYLIALIVGNNFNGSNNITHTVGIATTNIHTLKLSSNFFNYCKTVFSNGSAANMILRDNMSLNTTSAGTMGTVTVTTVNTPNDWSN